MQRTSWINVLVAGILLVGVSCGPKNKTVGSAAQAGGRLIPVVFTDESNPTTTCGRGEPSQQLLPLSFQILQSVCERVTFVEPAVQDCGRSITNLLLDRRELTTNYIGIACVFSSLLFDSPNIVAHVLLSHFHHLLGQQRSAR